MVVLLLQPVWSNDASMRHDVWKNSRSGTVEVCFRVVCNTAALSPLYFNKTLLHIFCYALLTLPCACVNEWHALRETSKELCSAVPRWSHRAYGRNLSGRYTDLPMPRGTQCLLREPTRNGQSVWTELSFLGQTFRSLWPFHNSLGIRSTNLIYRIIDFQGTCDLYCYCVLWLRSQTWIGSQESA